MDTDSDSGKTKTVELTRNRSLRARPGVGRCDIGASGGEQDGSRGDTGSWTTQACPRISKYRPHPAVAASSGLSTRYNYSTSVCLLRASMRVTSSNPPPSCTRRQGAASRPKRRGLVGQRRDGQPPVPHLPSRCHGGACRWTGLLWYACTIPAHGSIQSPEKTSKDLRESRKDCEVPARVGQVERTACAETAICRRHWLQILSCLHICRHLSECLRR